MVADSIEAQDPPRHSQKNLAASPTYVVGCKLKHVLDVLPITVDVIHIMTPNVPEALVRGWSPGLTDDGYRRNSSAGRTPGGFPQICSYLDTDLVLVRPDGKNTASNGCHVYLVYPANQ